MIRIDIDKPTSCVDCPCFNGDRGFCNLLTKEEREIAESEQTAWNFEVPSVCPIQED